MSQSRDEIQFVLPVTLTLKTMRVSARLASNHSCFENEQQQTFSLLIFTANNQQQQLLYKTKDSANTTENKYNHGSKTKD